MPLPTLLRIAAFCAYLAAWLVFVGGALYGALPALRRQAGAAVRLTAPTAVGAMLQVASAMVLTLSMPSGPLGAQPAHLWAVTVLAPIAAAVFVWSLRSAPRNAGSEALVTTGAFAAMRHPIYLAFLLMLVATGLLVTSALKLAIAMVVYLAGTEMRIAEEERELAGRFGDEYMEYRRRTRWRYLPGVR